MAPNATDRLRIDPLELPELPGRLGLCACPGGRRAMALDHDPRVDLMLDVEAIRAFPAAGVVTLIDERELVILGLDMMPRELQQAGMWWKHLPITDMGIPDLAWESRWQDEGPAIRDALAAGDNVVLHCWAGLGRTGTVAARVLIELGMDPATAISRVRHARPGAIQTRKQEDYVLGLARRQGLGSG